MKQKILLTCIISLLILAVIIWICREPENRNAGVPNQVDGVGLPKAASSTDIKTNSQSATALSKASSIESESAAIEKKYHEGFLDKLQAMQALWFLKNRTPQDFYGRVVDQDGQPINDAKVEITLYLNHENDEGQDKQKIKLATDENGLFEITGLHGAGLGVDISKEGYMIGARGEGYKGPTGGKASPADRAVYTMWKRRGAEKLIGCKFSAKIPHDGTVAAFDMATGKQSPSGDLLVTLAQYPQEVKKGWDKYDWSIKVEIPNGGLIEENDPYPFLAPADGYQPSFEFSESTNAIKWVGGLKKNFYFKTAQGKYGVLQLGVYPGRSPTGMEASVALNPSGSQNLEPK